MGGGEWGGGGGGEGREFLWEIFRNWGDAGMERDGDGGLGAGGRGAGVNSDCSTRFLKHHYRLPPPLVTK